MRASEQMKQIETELARIRGEIEKLKAQEEVLEKLVKSMTGATDAQKAPRKRSPSIKPLILEIMADAGFAGATSNEVDELVRAKVPTVAKDSVGSILSRLKSAGALVHDGERYYEKQYGPKPRDPFDGNLRAVN